MKRYALKASDITMVLLIFWSALYLWFNRPKNPDNYMVINQVHVADFERGVNPVVVYDREVKQEFIAEWVAKIYPINSDETVCQGSGRNHYKPGMKHKSVTLQWFLENDCFYELPRGDYHVKTTWLTGDNVLMSNVSNVFTVW